MAITLVTGPANAGKAQLILDAVCAHASRGEEPLLVVPTSADVHRYRRELTDHGLVLGVRVEQFEGLVEEIAKRARTTTRAISSLTREHILALLYRRARPDHPDTSGGLARALARFVGELEGQHVTPARLRAAVAAWVSASDGDAADGEWIARLYTGYQDALARTDRADKELRTVWALDELRRSPSRWRARPVLLYGFDDLTALELDAIETLGLIVDAPVTVSLSYEPGRAAFASRAGAVARLEPLAAEHTRLAPRADYYTRASREALHHLERSLFEEDPARVEAHPAVRMLEAGGERAELELVAGEIRALVDRGVDPSQIALVHRSPKSIAPLLEDVASQFEIPFSLARERRFRDTAIGAGLLGALRCASGEGTRRDLLNWLRVPGLLETPELADRLERSARRSDARTAAAARALWERDHWPLERIDKLRAADERGPLALMALLERELNRLFSASGRRSARLLGEDELDEAGALAAASGALDELRELTTLARDLAPTAGEIAKILENLTFEDEAEHDPRAVAVLGPLAVRARRVSTLFLCGLVDGVFPQAAQEEPLLPAGQRRRLAEASGLTIAPREDQLASERYLLYACVSRPESELVLSWHVADDDGTPRAASVFIEDICDPFEDSPRPHAARRSPGKTAWPAPPLGAIAARRPGGWPVRPAVIAHLANQELLDELAHNTVWSASALETWARCPVRWFVERLLRAQDLEPEAEPISRGALAHTALRDTLLELKHRTGSARLTPERLDLALELLREALARHSTTLELSCSPERAAGALRRLRADLERYLEHAAETDSPLEPTHLELPFGFPDEGDIGALDLGEGVMVRGRIDRIDLDAHGRAVLYDYKGKSAPAHSKWLAEGHFQLALYMRAAEKLLELEPVGGFYQPLAGQDLRPRGALMDDQPHDLASLRSDVTAPGAFTTLVEEVLAAARDAARQAARGELEPKPESCAFEGGCSYPSICRCGR